jgi:hypothetical protein
VTDANGNITWHPQEVLLLSQSSGGDGVFEDNPPDFLLLWDGTLYQPGGPLSSPYVSHLSDKEVCRILNTVDASGFFQEPTYYEHPFDGLGSHDIYVNAWKSNSSGSQVLNRAIAGAPYYDGLFCRNCPIPSAKTIIKPGLATVYFLVDKYYDPERKLAPIRNLKIQLLEVGESPVKPWPLTTITFSDLYNECEKASCFYSGMLVDETLANEIMKKIDGPDVFKHKTDRGERYFIIYYRAAWPYEINDWISGAKRNNDANHHKMPPDYTRTCGPFMGQYPILPLNSENEFWYYAPDGTWGAELVKLPDQPQQIRVVNNNGYEKFFKYEPNLFKRDSVNTFPRYWSEDGRYFFVNVLPSDFNSQNTPFVNSLGLQRISIEDGKAQYVFIGAEGESFAYGISYNGLQAAHIQQDGQPLKIVLTDLDSLKQKSAVLLTPDNGNVYTAAGTLVWSKDGNYLFVAANYLEDGKTKSAIIKIDMTNPTFQSIVNKIDSAIKLVHFALMENEAGICPLDASMGEYCEPRLDLTNESN